MPNQESKCYSISEDTLHVYIFGPQANAAVWETLCHNINKSIKQMSKNYIWHRDELKFSLPITDVECNIPAHLKSSTCFGDNVEDEWFMVYLILQISKQYKDLIFQFMDNDGEFLLIEAANYLPLWANPENTENRIYLYDQHIHMIPNTLIDVKTRVEVNAAIKLITQVPQLTLVSKEMEDAIFSRVYSYPQKSVDMFHNAILNLPISIAALLTVQPSLIAPIVNTYCSHDMLDAKLCQKLDYTNLVPVPIKFTKCLYAMLMHNRLLRNTGCKVKDSDKRSVLGLKIACGYNMIMKRYNEDPLSSKEFSQYINNLKKNGYFKENLEHSKDYNQLLEKAKVYYLENECPNSSYIFKNIKDVMNSEEYLNVKDSLSKSHISVKDMHEDCDDWLNINPTELNNFLNSQYSEKKVDLKKDESSPDTLSMKLLSFLKEEADIEGIDSRNTEDSDTDSINFNPDEFVECIQKMMDKLTTGNDEALVDSDNESDFETQDDALDEELRDKLNCNQLKENADRRVHFNLAQSVKEEGLTGPTSNLLNTMGIPKRELLDSDDDDYS